ncbi:MAG TPA: ABC transporter permease, partial [Caulobacteraceae bacterium]|nr:ABC transporter permease [Caulobacteraceae bacterium]
MERAADFSLSQTEHGRIAVCVGDWTAVQMQGANDRLAKALKGLDNVTIDLTAVSRCDTNGAHELLKAGAGVAGEPRFLARPQVTRLLELVENARQVEPSRPTRPRGLHELFERIGHGVVHVGLEVFDTMVFFGHLLVAVGRAMRNPLRIRWAACFALAERAGLDAIPIVTVTTFFIGAVVGLLGANMLTTFGAQVYVVELIGVAVLREFNVLITALLLAGRSASAFAAEIGAMKMNQEIDAMQVLGVDPFDALVF